MARHRGRRYRPELRGQRIRNALVDLEAVCNLFRLRLSTKKRIWVEAGEYAFVFHKAHLTRTKVSEFRAWLSQAKTTGDLKKLPFGIEHLKIVRRDWSSIPGAAIKKLAPAFPIRPRSSGGGGSHSTVPGHPAELDWFDLQKR